jgi:hypothetical protein
MKRKRNKKDRWWAPFALLASSVIASSALYRSLYGLDSYKYWCFFLRIMNIGVDIDFLNVTDQCRARSGNQWKAG